MAASNVVVGRLAAVAPKRFQKSALASTMTLGDALVDRRVRPRDWSRLLKHEREGQQEKDAMARQFDLAMSTPQTESLLRESMLADSAAANRKLAVLVESISSWEHALRLATLASKLQQSTEREGEPSTLTSSSFAATFSLPAATRSTVLHLYRTLVAGGKLKEATHMLLLNAAQLHRSNAAHQRRRSSEVKSFHKLIASLEAVNDVPAVKYLHEALTTSQEPLLRRALGPTAAFIIAKRLTESLLRQTTGQSKMELAAITLRFAVMCPGGALPASMRALWEHATPPPPVSRKLLSALDRHATEAAFLPWSTVQDHCALWASPLLWLRRERELIVAATHPDPDFRAQVSGAVSPSLSRLKSLLQGRQEPGPQVQDVLLGVTALKEIMRTGNTAEKTMVTSQQKSRRAVQDTLATLLSATTSPRMSLWLLSRKAQHSPLCRMARSQVVGPLLAYLVKDVALDNTRHASSRQLDRLTMSCAMLWRRSSVGRHRLLESVRSAEGSNFAAVVEVVLNVVSTLSQRQHARGAVVKNCSGRFPRALRTSIRRAWVAGWAAEHRTESSNARPNTKDVCSILARDIFLSDANHRSSALRSLPLAASVALVTSLHEAGLPFRDVKDLTSRLVEGRNGRGARSRHDDAAFLLDVIRLGSSRHYRVVSNHQTHDDTHARDAPHSLPSSSRVCAFPAFRAPTRSALIALQSLMKHCVALGPLPAGRDDAQRMPTCDAEVAAPSASVSRRGVTPEQRRFMEVLLTTFVKFPNRASELVSLRDGDKGQSMGVDADLATSSSVPWCRAESVEEHLRLMAALSVLSNSSDAEFVMCAASGLRAVMDPCRVQRWLDAEGLSCGVMVDALSTSAAV
jgi:hypothetical protein